MRQLLNIVRTHVENHDLGIPIRWINPCLKRDLASIRRPAWPHQGRSRLIGDLALVSTIDIDHPQIVLHARVRPIKALEDELLAVR